MNTNVRAHRQRPVFLNLFRIRLPVPGVLSIAHRLSGILLFLALPFVVRLLDLSLQDPAGFTRATALVAGFPGRLVLGLLLWSLVHHLLAGLRFLLIDLGLGVEREVAMRSAWAVNVAGVVVAAALAVVLS